MNYADEKDWLEYLTAIENTRCPFNMIGKDSCKGCERYARCTGIMPEEGD